MFCIKNVDLLAHEDLISETLCTRLLKVGHVTMDSQHTLLYIMKGFRIQTMTHISCLTFIPATDVIFYFCFNRCIYTEYCICTVDCNLKMTANFIVRFIYSSASLSQKQNLNQNIYLLQELLNLLFCFWTLGVSHYIWSQGIAGCFKLWIHFVYLCFCSGGKRWKQRQRLKGYLRRTKSHQKSKRRRRRDLLHIPKNTKDIEVKQLLISSLSYLPRKFSI